MKLSKRKIISGKKLKISGSKSETNRVLLLSYLFDFIHFENASNSDDSILMKKALKNNSTEIDIHHAGTAMRFLTAFFAIQPHSEVILKGSERMHQRPISVLVEALKELGADIQYLENEGFPPLKIKGKELKNNKVTINASVSSQYISALMLIGSKLKNGLNIYLEGKKTSLPYILMTANLLKEIGIKVEIEENLIKIEHFSSKNTSKKIIIESDWSSASYFYSMIALSEVESEVVLSNFKAESLQGDSVLHKIYDNFGVKTEFFDHKIRIFKKEKENIKNFNYDFTNCPDIAQTLAVTCFGLNINAYFTGLHTLKIKETDRLSALKTEIEKLGGKVKITEDSFELFCQNKIENQSIETYNDHRMAMAFAPLALKFNIEIKNPEVVSKSYPNFWENFLSISSIDN